MSNPVTIGDCTLYLGDCREVMSAWTANWVDMIWTDPPYGHSNHDGDLNAQLNDHRGIENKPIAGDSPDSMRALVDEALTQAARVLKRHSSCCCCCGGGGGPRPTFAWLAQRMDTAGLSFFHSIIWDKRNPGLGWRYRRQHEMIMVAHRAGGKLLWRDDNVTARNVFSMMPPRNRSHPNEKPVLLPSHFIGLHSREGDTILDPFMGSGTTGVACAKMGRKFIGVEIDEKYFNVACKRIEEAYRQPDMFVQKAEKQIQEALI